jgi:hypothetical protein
MYCWILESIGLVCTVLLDTRVWKVGIDCWILESGELVCIAGYWSLESWYVPLDTGV